MPMNPRRPSEGRNRSERTPAAGWIKAPASRPMKVSRPSTVACDSFSPRPPSCTGSRSVLIPSKTTLKGSQRMLIPRIRRI